MFRKWMWQLCGLAIAMSSGAVALGHTRRHRAAAAATSLNQLALGTLSKPCSSRFQQSSGGMPGAGRIGLGLDTSYSGSKPFTGFSQGPTVSPYLNLFRVDQNGFQGFNYSTLVQPQLRQQQLNQQQQQQNKHDHAPAASNLGASRLQRAGVQGRVSHGAPDGVPVYGALLPAAAAASEEEGGAVAFACCWRGLKPAICSVFAGFGSIRGGRLLVRARLALGGVVCYKHGRSSLS